MTCQMDESLIITFLYQNDITRNCSFGFNGKILIIGGECSSPAVYDLEKNTIEFIDGNISRKDEDHITAVVLSPDGCKAAWGYADGSVAICNMETKEVSPRHKLLHKSPISHLAFLGSLEKIVICDVTGLVSIFTDVHASLLDFTLETAIIDLQRRIMSFTSLFPDYFAFMSEAGMTLFKDHMRRVIPILTTGTLQPDNLTCSIGTDGKNVRCIVGCGETFDVGDVNTDTRELQVKIDQREAHGQLLCSFVADYNHFIVVTVQGSIKVINQEGRCVYEESERELPAGIPQKNIMYVNNTLIFFTADHIVQIKIDPSELDDDQ